METATGFAALQSSEPPKSRPKLLALRLVRYGRLGGVDDVLRHPRRYLIYVLWFLLQ